MMGRRVRGRGAHTLRGRGPAATAVPSAAIGLYTALGFLLIIAVVTPESAVAQGSGRSEAAVAPTADANGPYFTHPGEPILFDGTNSTDPEQGPLVYAWDFGDETAGSGPTPEHSYAKRGSYNVRLVVTDAGSTLTWNTVPATSTRAATVSTTNRRHP